MTSLHGRLGDKDRGAMFDLSLPPVPTEIFTWGGAAAQRDQR